MIHLCPLCKNPMIYIGGSKKGKFEFLEFKCYQCETVLETSSCVFPPLIKEKPIGI